MTVEALFAGGFILLGWALWVSVTWSGALRARARCELAWAGVARGFDARADAVATFASAAAAHPMAAELAAELADQARLARSLGPQGRPVAEQKVAALVRGLWLAAQPFAAGHRQLSVGYEAVEAATAELEVPVAVYNRHVSAAVSSQDQSVSVRWVIGQVFTDGIPTPVPQAAVR